MRSFIELPLKILNRDFHLRPDRLITYTHPHQYAMLQPTTSARQTQGQTTSGIEGVPPLPAVTNPSLFFAGRPAAERAADARISRTFALLFVEFAIQNN
jgi:hypothetical protein